MPKTLPLLGPGMGRMEISDPETARMYIRSCDHLKKQAQAILREIKTDPAIVERDEELMRVAKALSNRVRSGEPLLIGTISAPDRDPLWFVVHEWKIDFDGKDFRAVNGHLAFCKHRPEYTPSKIICVRRFDPDMLLSVPEFVPFEELPIPEQEGGEA